MNELENVMSKEVVCSTPDSSLRDIAKKMVEGDCGEIPLVNNEDERKLIGVITDRDIVCRTLAVDKNPWDLTANEIMTSPVISGKVVMSLDECMNLMKENKIRRLPIVDEDNCLCGIVAQADLVHKADEKDAVEMISRVSKSGSDSQSQVTH
jgi:CBS domain-containing protein